MAMFVYTRATALKIYDDLKRFIFALSLTVQSIYIAYIIYALIVGAGILYANIALLVISTAYLVFLIVKHKKQKKMPKDTVAKVGKAYRWSKIGIKTFTLAATLYGIHIATTKVTTTAVIFAALTVIAWMMNVIFELIKLVFERYFEIIESAISKDLNPIKKIINIIPGVNLETQPINESIDRELNDLGAEFKASTFAKKLLKKEEKKSKLRETGAKMLDKVRGVLPKKKNKPDSNEITVVIEDKNHPVKKD